MTCNIVAKTEKKKKCPAISVERRKYIRRRILRENACKRIFFCILFPVVNTTLRPVAELTPPKEERARAPVSWLDLKTATALMAKAVYVQAQRQGGGDEVDLDFNVRDEAKIVQRDL